MTAPTPLRPGFGPASRRDGSSVETKTVTLTRDGRTVELIGVFHVASPAFWAYVQGRILARLAGHGHVHTEGVRDKRRRVDEAHRRLANRLIRRHGLIAQGAALKPHFARHMMVTDLHLGEIGALYGQGRVRALRLLTKLPTTALAVMPTEMAHIVLGSVAESRAKGNPGALVRSLVLDMNDAREGRAITAIERSTTDVTAIWGAAHIPNIVGQLVELGWTVTAESWHPVLVLSQAAQDLEDVAAERSAARAARRDATAAVRVHE